MEIVVTSVGGDGTVHRATVNTAGRADADRWEGLAASAHLEVPPPYRPEPGQPVYEIRAGGDVAQVAEQNLTGPLRELVTAVLTEGGQLRPRPVTCSARHAGRPTRHLIAAQTETVHMTEAGHPPGALPRKPAQW